MLPFRRDLVIFCSGCVQVSDDVRVVIFILLG